MRASTTLRRLRPRSGYDLVAVLALVLALGGGTAMAAIVVSSNSQVAPNTISGSKRPSGFPNDNVANGSIDTSDLSANARPHRLEFDQPGNGTQVSIATVGNVALSAKCESTGGFVVLYFYARNNTFQLGTINNSLVLESTVDNQPDDVFTSGEFIGANETKTVDEYEHPTSNTYLFATTSSARVEGQVVFQTPGRVTTIVFHASVAASRCTIFGTAVTATQP